jgi:hypothetical protein
LLSIRVRTVVLADDMRASEQTDPDDKMTAFQTFRVASRVALPGRAGLS